MKAWAINLYNHQVDLYWLPVRAGGHFVRWNGRLY